MSANFIAVFALQDYYSGNGTNENVSSNGLEIYEQAQPDFYSTNPRLNSDKIYWGLTAYYTYRAYKHQFLLDIATRVWNDTFQFFVTPKQAASGSQPSRNVSFQSRCSGSSVAGAVFWLPDSKNDSGSNGETVGPFMALSAYLFEATRDSKYSTAAELTGQFVQNHLYNGTIVFDGLDLATCQVHEALIPYNTGFYLEALAVLANVTNNSTWSTLLNHLVASSATFKAWQGSNGIINEDGPPNSFQTSLKSIFIRGLHEAWARADHNSPMASFIQSYIYVQLNAILDFASVPNTNVFSSNWLGPPATSLDASGNVAALDVFNAALNMTGPPGPISSSTSASAPAPTPTQGSNTPSSRTSSSNTGAIVGGVIGGIIGAFLITLALVFCIRRRNRHNDHLPNNFRTSIHEVEPFPITLSSHPPTAAWLSGPKSRHVLLNGASDPPASMSSESQTPPSVDPPSTSPTGASSHGDWTQLAELPSLVRRLNGLLGLRDTPRPVSMPPEYDASH